MKTGRVAVVTGASAGIGAEIARQLSAAGFTVVLTARDRRRLQAVAGKLVGKSLVVPADLRSSQSVKRMAAVVLRQVGVPEAIVNVAGVWHDEKTGFQGPPSWATPFERTEQVIDVGLLGSMRVLRALLPAMVKKRRGHVIQIGCGFAGPHEAKGWLHYYVTNKAISALTEGLAAELRESGIQANCIAPWYVSTEYVKKFYANDAARALAPARVAECVAGLLSGPFASDVSGQTIELRSEGDA